MTDNIRYVHTNLISKDWRKLAGFYIKVLQCEPLLPERDFKGKELDAGTGLTNAHLTGIHLRLPGYAENGPTLEIFSYDDLKEKAELAVNRLGYGHIAFSVDDVKSMRNKILENGGNVIGEIVTLKISDTKEVTWCYVTDPEGNIIELQRIITPAV